MPRPLAVALLSLAAAGCGVGSIPVVGGLVGGSPSGDMMRQAQANQANAMLNFTFRPAWKNLIDEHKYKSALAYIEARKGEIGEANEKLFISDTHRECRTYVAERVARFRRNLQEIKSQKDLAAMKPDDFAYNFELAAPDELTFRTPEYDWARAHYGDLEDFRTRKPNGESLLRPAAAAAALPADEDGEFRWFDITETLAFRAVGDAMRDEIDKAQDAPNADRAQAARRVDALREKWAGLAKSLESNDRAKAKVGEHAVALARIPEGFPKDLPDLDKIDVNACVSAPDPEGEFQKLERTLKGLENRTGVSRESRQRLYTLLVASVSLRTFLAGREESDAVAELRGYGEKLKRVGGPGDAKAYGARVQGVFDVLLR